MLNNLMILSWCPANQSLLCKTSAHHFTWFGRIGILDPENANFVQHSNPNSPSPHFPIEPPSWALNLKVIRNLSVHQAGSQNRPTQQSDFLAPLEGVLYYQGIISLLKHDSKSIKICILILWLIDVDLLLAL